MQMCVVECWTWLLSPQHRLWWTGSNWILLPVSVKPNSRLTDGQHRVWCGYLVYHVLISVRFNGHPHQVLHFFYYNHYHSYSPASLSPARLQHEQRKFYTWSHKSRERNVQIFQLCTSVLSNTPIFSLTRRYIFTQLDSSLFEAARRDIDYLWLCFCHTSKIFMYTIPKRGWWWCWLCCRMHGSKYFLTVLPAALPKKVPP